MEHLSLILLVSTKLRINIHTPHMHINISDKINPSQWVQQEIEVPKHKFTCASCRNSNLLGIIYGFPLFASGLIVAERGHCGDAGYRAKTRKCDTSNAKFYKKKMYFLHQMNRTLKRISNIFQVTVLKFATSVTSVFHHVKRKTNYILF